MFKLRHFNWALMLCVALFSTFTFTACSSDSDDEDPDQEENCAPNFLTAVATGSFMGEAFTVVQGTAKEDPFESDRYLFNLYGEDVMGDACDGFNFDKPKLSIIFSVPKGEGIYQLGLSNENSVTFNDATITNEVTADVAVCGAIEILSISSTAITGQIDASANADSDLNGTFTVELCP